MQTVDTANIEKLQESVASDLEKVGHHQLFGSIKSIEDVRTFMDHHVYAVWDFMSLLKSLQRKLTCTAVPWIPVGSSSTRRLINEICLDEESDELPDGRCHSHLELYFLAMEEAGADAGKPRDFIEQVASGVPVDEAMKAVSAPAAARRFVADTMQFIATGQPHVIASAFTIGREEAIPVMFDSLVTAMCKEQPGLDTLKLYLERHIELDGDKHGPLGLRMIADLCGDSQASWKEANAAAQSALQSRCRLWDGILAAIRG